MHVCRSPCQAWAVTCMWGRRVGCAGCCHPGVTGLFVRCSCRPGDFLGSPPRTDAGVADRGQRAWGLCRWWPVRGLACPRPQVRGRRGPGGGSMRICKPTRFQRGPPGMPVGRIRDWRVRPMHRPSGCRAGSCLWASHSVRPRDGSLSLLFNPCFLCCPELLVLPGVSW